MISIRNFHPHSRQYTSLLSCKLIHTEKVSLFLAVVNIIASIFLAYFYLNSSSSLFFLWVFLVFLWICCSLLPFFGSYLLKPALYLPVMCCHVVASILGVFFSIPCLVSLLRYKQNMASWCPATNVAVLLLGSLLNIVVFLEYFQTVRYLEDLLRFRDTTIRQPV